MQYNALCLSTTLASRICHDLINPIGAIQNGLELSQLSSEKLKGLEWELIETSSINAANRIKFFRIAFGMSDHRGQLSPRNARKILEPIFSRDRFKVLWNINQNISRSDSQIIFLSILCLETAMPMGGELIITKNENSLAITGFSTNLTFNLELWNWLSQPPPNQDISPKNIHFVMLLLVCQKAGKEIAVIKNIDERNLSINL